MEKFEVVDFNFLIKYIVYLNFLYGLGLGFSDVWVKCYVLFDVV